MSTDTTDEPMVVLDAETGEVIPLSEVPDRLYYLTEKYKELDAEKKEINAAISSIVAEKKELEAGVVEAAKENRSIKGERYSCRWESGKARQRKQNIAALDENDALRSLLNEYGVVRPTTVYVSAMKADEIDDIYGDLVDSLADALEGDEDAAEQLMRSYFPTRDQGAQDRYKNITFKKIEG